LFSLVDGSFGSTGNAIKVTALSALQKIAMSPLPNMTAPMYLNGKNAAIVKTEP